MMTGPALFTGAAAEWDTFVRQQPHTTTAHAFAWKRIIERAYGHECPYLVARGSEGSIRAALPLVHIRSLAFGRFLVSMPYLNSGGPVGDLSAAEMLVQDALARAADSKCSLLELRSTAPLTTTLPRLTEKVVCMLELPDTADALMRSFPAKLRSQIRRPEREGITLKFGADQVTPFHTVFARNMRDLGSPTHPLAFFAAASSEFGDAAWFACAYLHGRPVAAGCAIRWGDEVEIIWASTLREYNAFAPNMALYWRFMERACNEGIRRFNFGRCTPGTGSHNFKRQWGAQDIPLHWLRSGPAGVAAPPAQSDARYALATRLWQRMPVPLATFVGSRLRGGIPS